MHITLISPPQAFTKSQVTAGVVPPLGLMYLSGYLKQHKINVKLIDSVGSKFSQYTPYIENILLRGMKFDEILDEIPEDTDLIGIAALYSSAHIIYRELIDLIKSTYPDKLIVIGGAHATILTDFVLQDTKADLVVLGEGELTLLDLCQNVNNFKNIKGIAYKENGSITYNPRRDLISDLDTLPLPDRTSISVKNYSDAAEPHGSSATGRWTTLLSSRGCPFNCTFCTTPKIWLRRWRYRSPEKVVQEMIELNKDYGIVDFHFEDENMGFNKKWLHRFCDLLIEQKLNFRWQPSNGLRVETVLDPGLMKKMKDSGCTLVVFTLESASARVRNEIIKKSLDISDIENAIALANQVGIRSNCYFMIGLPGESYEEAMETLRFVWRMARRGLDEPVISIFSMLPGCKLFNDLNKEGTIKLDLNFFHNLLVQGDLRSSKSWTDEIDGITLKNLRTRGYLLFAVNKTIFHPFKSLKSVLNIFRGSTELKSERVVRTLIKRIFFFKLRRDKGLAQP